MSPQKALVLLRVYLGLMFLRPAFAKLFGTLTPTALTFDMGRGQVETFIGGYAVTHGYGWYRSFLQNVVMHHVGLFGALVTIGEWYVIVAMLFGVTTRLAAGVAIFMLLNFLAAKGISPLKLSPDLTFAVMALVIMLGSAGRTLGVDRILHERYPRNPIW